MRTRAPLLVGRQPELDQVLTQLRAAVTGDGPAVFLTGEAGVGKSRLVTEVAGAAFVDGLVVIRGRASSSGPVAVLRPFAEALSTIERRGLLPSDQLGGYRPLLARVLPQLAEAGVTDAGIGTAAPVVAFAEAVLRVLARIAGSTGCLLVLEDLHEADTESIAVLDYLVDNIWGLPIGILGTLRDEQNPAREMLTEADRRGAIDLVAIRRLDHDRTAALIEACLGTGGVPAPIAELVWRNSMGNPLVVEELLYDMVDSGQLVQGAAGWDLALDPVVRPPSSLVRSVGRRVERLGAPARRALVAAAVYGEHFPVTATMAASGDTEHGFLDTVHAATLAQLLIVDEVPGWYCFRHPLIVSALLELVTAQERREAALRLAEAVVAEDPDLTGQSCRVAAKLYADAGQTATAGGLYARAGRRAFKAGAVDSAAADLTEAVRLLSAGGRIPPDLMGELVTALVESGNLDRAVEVVDSLDNVLAGSNAEQRALIHVHLAWGCYLSGRLEQGRDQLAAARALVAGLDSAAVQVQSDVIAACLDLDGAGSTPPEIAAAVAREAATAAEQSGAAEAACRAWHAVGRILRSRDLDGSTRCFERIVQLADEHDLPGWGLFGMVGAAGNRWLQNGDGLPLRVVRDQARRLGSVTILLSVEAHLCLHDVLTAAGGTADIAVMLESCVEQATRFNNANLVRYGLATLIVAAGQRADRVALDQVMARFDAVGGNDTVHRELAAGMGSAIALALEGNDIEALAVLTGIARAQSAATPYYLTGTEGLALLLAEVTGRSRAGELDAVLAAERGTLRWNRQFLLLAQAVRAGRAGDVELAGRCAKAAAADAAIYPMARHLGARLVASAAAEAGWGEPVADVRAAEAWFHEQGVAVAARTCRDVLRSLGASVQQRRDGAGAVPGPMRAAGVTVREFEVGLLARQHLGNKAIGDRLHISPRTVEKHIAALLVKLAVPDRATLINRIDELDQAG